QTVAIKAETFPSDPPTTISTGMEIRANGGTGVTYGSVTYITNNNANTNIGDELKISTSANSNFGFRSEVGNASNQNYGVYSSTISGGANYNYAVYGNACNADRNFGIYGKTCGTDNGNLAGFFEGDFSFTGAFIPPSDQNLKTDIQTIQSPSETLSQLAPKIYHFNQDVGDLNLPTGPQMGLIAQEVEDVLPFLVQSITKPAVMDSSGNILTEAYTYKGLKYLDFIALLIAGFNEQSELTETQAQIVEDQEATIEELEGEVAALTSSLNELQNSVAQLESMVQESLQKSEDCCAKVLGEKVPGVINGKQNTLEQNVPNPFEQETRIDFNLAASGNVKLMITNATGQTMELLANGAFSSGKHSVTWNASGYAPGVYYYSLYVDGELLTKRMIKL
ncbi:MAG: tail fiber domain-containing protein, partial [Cryomorphaceae bacterium]